MSLFCNHLYFSESSSPTFACGSFRLLQEACSALLPGACKIQHRVFGKWSVSIVSRLKQQFSLSFIVFLVQFNCGNLWQIFWKKYMTCGVSKETLLKEVPINLGSHLAYCGFPFTFLWCATGASGDGGWEDCELTESGHFVRRMGRVGSR